MKQKKVTIVEVGPRDGLQSEPEILPTASKIKYITQFNILIFIV